MPDLDSLLLRLAQHGVKFVLIGGYAAAAHGAGWVTLDVDVCLDLSTANLMRLQRALADLHPVHRMTPRRIPLGLTRHSCRGLKNLYLDTDLGQLDCLGNVRGIGSYREARKRSMPVDIRGQTVRILNLDALIEAKQAMGEPRDLQAVRLLRAVRAAVSRPTRRKPHR